MRFVLLLSTLFPAAATAQGADSAESPLEVRAAVVAFEDFQEEGARWEQLFAEFSRQSQPPLHFRLAAGTYGDVLHWIRQGMVDLAVINPGVFAETLRELGQAALGGDSEYLATVGLPAATSVWASPDRHFADNPRAVPILGRGGAGFHGNPVPGDGERCRSRLALGVLPLCKPLPLRTMILAPAGSGLVKVSL